MPTISIRQALTANQFVPNVLAGSQYEFVGFPALMEAGLLADATGVQCAFASGTDILLEDGSPVDIGTINTKPKYPDQFYIRDAVAPGDRLKLSLRDTSGAARVVMVEIRLTPA
jgi:hypothetical protein